MQIRLTLDQLEPPAGTVRLISASPSPSDVEEGEECGQIDFAGWLGMLRALSELIDGSPR